MRLPTRSLPLIAALCVILTGSTAIATEAGAAPVPGSERVLRLPAPKPLRDVALIDQRGKPFQLSSLRGQTVLVFFGFTHCPDVCPTTLHILRLLTRSAGEDLRRVRVVMISVDPERDTPQALKAMLEPLSRDFVGVTGSARALRAAAEQFSAVFFKGEVDRATGSYSVDHSSQVYLVDAQGRLRAVFYNAPVPAMAQEIRRMQRPAS